MSDVPTGPKEPRSTVLSIEDEAVVVAFRRHTLLPLDHCLYALQGDVPASDAVIPAPRPSAPCINHLPEVDGDKPAKRKFETYPIGYVHVDVA